MKAKTLNFITGGPSAGKTTLTAQIIHAMLLEEPFFIPGLDIPKGEVTWVQTDRSAKDYKQVLESLNLWDHPKVHIVNLPDETELHDATMPVHKEEFRQLERLRDAINKRLKQWPETQTLVLDLYEEFQTAENGNAHRMAYEGRANLRWAIRLNVCLIGLPYIFKQTTLKQATRAQDRQAGSLMGQASANFKIAIIDAEELQKPYSMIFVKPGPGEGLPSNHKVLRKDNGLFMPWDGPDEDEQDRLDAPTFLRLLPPAWSPDEYKELYAAHEVAKATAYRWLKLWVESETVLAPDVKHNQYRKNLQ